MNKVDALRKIERKSKKEKETDRDRERERLWRVKLLRIFYINE